jgi:hypothetical protein
VELTGKEWKALRVVGTFMLILGLMGLVGAKNGDSPFSSFLAVAGGLLYLVARAGAWWNHG